MWDKNKPEGQEIVKLGAYRLRELKADIEEILKKEHHFIIDGSQLKIYHKFSILTTSQEASTKDGQIWFNSELRQFSYKKGGQIYRNARYLPKNFTMLVLKMPLNSYWGFVTLQNDYVLGVDNNIRFHNTGKSFWSIQHNHSLFLSSDIHEHRLNIRVGDAYGGLWSVEVVSGLKTFNYFNKKHHNDTTANVSIEAQHSHYTTIHEFKPSYYRCFFVKRV